ncbi:helix-turn-helix domain-containing protein [Oscillospiraceae bacterium OttesenSCG-928-G22]|nr:helix-turn-helix domain-containing protein [Oscillospiraceae bacterium OttesenSCG-928-G22]
MLAHHEIIRGLREDKDLRQQDIAELIGVSQQMYSRYENGEYDMPAGALRKLADFYGVSVDYLLGRTECKEGLSSLNQKAGGRTVGGIVSAILSLSPAGQRSVTEYIDLQRLKEKNGKA